MAVKNDLRDGALKAVGPFFLEAVAGFYSFEGLNRAMQRSKETVSDRILYSPNKAEYLEAARHIIGIEGWGQRRLKVALGEPLQMDSYHRYRPSEARSTTELSLQFSKLRMNTCGLIPLLEGAKYEEKIPHNLMGPLSVKAWLYYLHLHAWTESFRLRRT